MHPSPDVLALLALGEEAGTPAELEHISTCPQCRAEVAELARAVVAGRSGRAGDGGLVTPPDRVWTAIRAELGFGSLDGATYGAHGLPEMSTVTARPRHARAERNGSEPAEPAEPDEPDEPEVADRPATPEPTPRTPEVVDLGAARAARSSRGRRLTAVLVAAAVALVLGMGLGLGLDRLLGPRQTVLWTAELQAQPDFAGSTGRASVVEDSQGSRTLQIELDSPVPVTGSQQVWLIDRGISQTKPIGWINGKSGQWPLPADLDPAQFPVVDVSEEPPGDVDLAHSKVSIVRGTLNV